MSGRTFVMMVCMALSIPWLPVVLEILRGRLGAM